jgi:hypothetical protein
MRIFLSHSHADRKLAATLRERLEAVGLTVSSFDEDPGTASGWHRELEEAIRSASAILLLFNSRGKADDPQRVAWRLALEAVWANPSKRLIPVLLQDAELPAFVKSASSGGEVQAIRLRDRKDLGPVIQAILQTLGVLSREQIEKRRSIESMFDVIPTVTDEDRKRQREDFAAIRKYAEQLKH